MRKYAFELWDNVRWPIGVVQIIRSANEHVCRYKKFARFLNKNGYVVVCALNNPNDNIFDVQQKILKQMRRKYKSQVFLFGCEYGGIIAQQISNTTNLCDGCICVPNGLRYSWFNLWMARIIAWVGTNIRRKNTAARWVQRTLTTQPARHKGLTHCMSYGLYCSLLKNVLKSDFSISLKNPILVIGNKYDINNMNRQLARVLFDICAPYNPNRLNMVIYPDVTHELLCDTKWHQAQNDVLDFLSKHNVNS